MYCYCYVKNCKFRDEQDHCITTPIIKSISNLPVCVACITKDDEEGK